MASVETYQPLERGYPHLTGELTVRAVERLSPRMARFVLEGPSLANLPDEQPGEIITLIWPANEGDALALPLPGWVQPDGAPEQHQRNYTIRSFDPGGPSIVVDFVLHGPHGRASAWAEKAQPGDVIGFAGPRLHYFPEPGAQWTLLAGDETALPAIAATLERLPEGQQVFALIEVASAEERQPIAARPPALVTWIERDGEKPHESTRLLEAVRALELPDGPGKIWVAGESGVVRALREHIRNERGLTIGPLQAIGYWKHRETPERVDDDLY
ncbi:MAG: siderophore-interacting protein [Solirubrobacteraceae bacterium]|nr:siderophore-interacting protein [Solirubrobacteraceae bacterium]